MKREFFKPSEYTVAGVAWYNRMSPKLLVKTDLLRWWWGDVIEISQVKGALGRDKAGTSQHSWKQFNEVRAEDVLPKGIHTQKDAWQFFNLAKQAGFTGIGFYPDWKPRPGFHLDVREENKQGNPAIWGGINDKNGEQIYVSLEKAISRLPEN